MVVGIDLGESYHSLFLERCEMDQYNLLGKCVPLFSGFAADKEARAWPNIGTHTRKASRYNKPTLGGSP